MGRRVVVFCHPAPGSSGFDPDPTTTSSWGVHLVAIERPGYGVSTPLRDDERPTIADRADDIGTYLSAVSDEARASGQPLETRVGVIGWSAGGRVALALAARYPGLVDRVAVIATPAPHSAVPWIPSDYAGELDRLNDVPAAAAKTRLRAMLAAQVGSPTELGAVGVQDSDAQTLELPGLGDRLRRMLREAYRQGPTGVADDLLSYATDEWGFDLGDVRASTLLVYGGADRVASSAHGRWYRRRIPHAHLTVKPRKGHLVVVDAWRDVLAHVDPAHGRALPA